MAANITKRRIKNHYVPTTESHTCHLGSNLIKSEEKKKNPAWICKLLDVPLFENYKTELHIKTHHGDTKTKFSEGTLGQGLAHNAWDISGPLPVFVWLLSQE